MLTSITLATLLFVAQAATPTTDRFVVAGAIGRGTTWDDEGSIGGGLLTGGAFEWRVSPRLSLDFDIERLAHARDTPGLRFSGRTIFVSAGVRYHFARTGTTPFVGGGIGIARYSGELLVRFEPPPTLLPRSSTSSVVHALAGVEVPVGSRLLIAPELRLRFCQPEDDFAPWAAIGAGVRVGWRF